MARAYVYRPKHTGGVAAEVLSLRRFARAAGSKNAATAATNQGMPVSVAFSVLAPKDDTRAIVATTRVVWTFKHAPRWISAEWVDRLLFATRRVWS